MSIKYTYSNNNKCYSYLLKKNYQIKRDLNFKVINNGLVLPLTKKENFFGQSGGVIDSSGNCIKESLTLRTDPFIDNRFCKNWFVGLNEKPFEDFSNLKILNKKVIYIGALPAHYGHFIFEGLSRVWIKKIFNPKEFLFVYISILNNESHLLEIFNLLGFPEENILKVETPTKFEQIIVPEPSLRLNDYYHEDFRKTVALNYKKKNPNTNTTIPTSMSKKV